MILVTAVLKSAGRETRFASKNSPPGLSALKRVSCKLHVHEPDWSGGAVVLVAYSEVFKGFLGTENELHFALRSVVVVGKGEMRASGCKLRWQQGNFCSKELNCAAILDHVCPRPGHFRRHVPTMLRRPPTMIKLDQLAVQEVKDTLAAKRKDEESMVLDDGDGDGSTAPLPFMEQEKRKRALMTQAQRLGIAD